MKFYESVTHAITDVVQELEAHTRHDYLRREFAAIITKIDAKWPHARSAQRNSPRPQHLTR